MGIVIFLLVAVGAFAGGMLRWALNISLPVRVGTFTANTLACLLAGVVIGSELAALETALLVTGFCGALSTWSTLAKELGELIRAREWGSLARYGGATLVVGTASVQAGLMLGAYFL